MTSSGRVYDLPVSQADTALSVLKQATGLSGSSLKDAASAGCVWLASPDGVKPRRLRRLKQSLKGGDRLYCYYDPLLLDQAIEPAECVDDRQAYSVWLKPRGMLSQGTRWGDRNSIGRYAEMTLNRPTYLVHRLDRMTAGLMIVSHQKKLVQAFTRMFSEGTINKTYLAVVDGQFPDQPAQLNMPLDDQQAETLATLKNYHPETNQSLLQVQIISGRKHQIRRHLSMAGYPLVGDRLYGAAGEDAPDLQLVAAGLDFTCPVSGQLRQYQIAQQRIGRLLVNQPE